MPLPEDDNSEYAQSSSSRSKIGRVFIKRFDTLTTTLALLVGALVVVIVVMAFFIVNMAATNAKTIAAAKALRDETIATVRSNNEEVLNQVMDSRNDLNTLRSDLNSFRAEVSQKMEIQDIKTDTRIIELRDIRAENKPANTSVVSLQ